MLSLLILTSGLQSCIVSNAEFCDNVASAVVCSKLQLVNESPVYPEMHKYDPLPKLSCTTLTWPADWREVFGVKRPLILDIGFGYGHTLEHLHHTHPDHNIVGLEIDSTCLVKAEKAIQRKRMGNVRVVRGRAETALHHLFLPESLHQVHVNFPDPWFKARHSGRRLMQRDTLDAIVHRMVLGGMFYLATDIIAYAEMSAELLKETPGLTPKHERPWVNKWPGRIVTKYEKKARKAGRECYYFAYQRNRHAVPPVTVIKELAMPHMVIRSALSLDEMMTQFAPEAGHAHKDLRIKFLSAYRNDRAVLFEVYIHEPTIEQHLALLLVRREKPNEYTLKASRVGNPRSTQGLHLAVGTLGKLLAGLDPEAQILENKVTSRFR